MKRSTTLLIVFTLVLCFGQTAVAQHGGFGAAAGKGFSAGAGRGFGSIPSTSNGGAQGHFGNDVRSHSGDSSNVDTSKGVSGVSGKKTAGDLLTQNTKLSANLQGLLPAGTNVQDAAKGFDNLGQFVAATHVSHNLGIPFDQLKTEMMNGSSLGESVQKLRPNVDSRHESIKANEQALHDIEESVGRGKSASVH
jgi:hypothetical protein